MSERSSKADKWINPIERDICRNHIDMKKRFVCGFYFLVFVVFESEAMQSNIERKTFIAEAKQGNHKFEV